MSGEYPIKQMCEILEVSRSGYYDWLAADRSARQQAEAALQAQIQSVHETSGETYGSPRVTVALRKQGATVGRRRVARLMRQAGLRGNQKPRFRVATTDSRHDYPIAPNRLLGQPVPVKPDRVWVTDMTYIETGEGWLYLAGIMDRCSRLLVGWAMGSSLATDLPLAALQMAVKRRRPPPGLIHHSDRGVQYASGAYRDALAAHQLIPSMSRSGNCYDNGAMEAFWSTLKKDLVHRCRFATRAEATTAIFRYIEAFYNRSRLHSALGYQSPLDYESSLS
jgi:putative transposase